MLFVCPEIYERRITEKNLLLKNQKVLLFDSKTSTLKEIP